MTTNKITRHSASATLDLQADGVLIVRLCGPLTGDALLHFKMEIVERYGPRIRGFIVDYRVAVIALDGAELDAVLEGEPDGSAPSMPAAMVVLPASNDLFKAHAQRMAGMHGITRRVFNQAPPALVWVRERAGRSRQ